MVGKSLWCERNIISQDVMLEETNLWSVNSKSASSYHLITDYFPITVQHSLLFSLSNNKCIQMCQTAFSPVFAYFLIFAQIFCISILFLTFSNTPETMMKALHLAPCPFKILPRTLTHKSQLVILVHSRTQQEAHVENKLDGIYSIITRTPGENFNIPL